MLSIFFASSRYFLPRRSITGRVTGFGPFFLASVASGSCGVVSPDSLRASFSAFSAASSRAFWLRLPDFATCCSFTSCFSAPAIASSISAIVFFSFTANFSSAAFSSNSAFFCHFLTLLLRYYRYLNLPHLNK